MWRLVEESLAAGCAVHFPLSLPSIAADDVKQLVTHLITALTELHRNYGHFSPR